MTTDEPATTDTAWCPQAGDRVAVYRAQAPHLFARVDMTTVDYVTSNGVMTFLGAFDRETLTMVGGDGARLLPAEHPRVLAALAAKELTGLVLAASGALTQVMALRAAEWRPDAALGAMVDIEAAARTARERIQALTATATEG